MTVYLDQTNSLRSFQTILLHCLLAWNVAVENTEARFPPSFNTGKKFFLYSWIFSLLYLLDFLFQGTSYSLFHHLYLPHLSHFFWVSEMMFFCFFLHPLKWPQTFTLCLIQFWVMSILFFTALTYLLVLSSCHLALRLSSTLPSFHLILLIYIILSLSSCSVEFFLLKHL